MKPNQSKGGNPVHQTVAEKIQFESAGQSIQIEFTDQQLSPHAGTATFWSFVHESEWRELVARCLPHPAPMIGDCKRTSLPSGKPSKGREAKRANALIAGIGRGIEKRDHREIAFR